MWKSSFRAQILMPTGAAVAALLALASAARAGDTTSSDKIREALTAKPRLTRSMSGATSGEASAAATATERNFINGLRNRATRSLSLDEREQIATIAATRPNIDLEINFEYNSAQISPNAAAQVAALGEALSSPTLKGDTFVVAGYTDAIGGETYNQDLSERRADAIKRILVEKYGLDGGNLVTVGYGKTKLKDPDHPMAPANRRVQVVTMAGADEPK